MKIRKKLLSLLVIGTMTLSSSSFVFANNLSFSQSVESVKSVSMLKAANSYEKTVTKIVNGTVMSAIPKSIPYTEKAGGKVFSGTLYADLTKVVLTGDSQGEYFIVPYTGTLTLYVE